jgi:hypothetical protein
MLGHAQGSTSSDRRRRMAGSHFLNFAMLFWAQLYQKGNTGQGNQ